MFQKNIAVKCVCMCVLALMQNQSLLAPSARGPYALLFCEIVIDGHNLAVNKNPIPTNNKISLSLTPCLLLSSPPFMNAHM